MSRVSITDERCETPANERVRDNRATADQLALDLQLGAVAAGDDASLGLADRLRRCAQIGPDDEWPEWLF